MTAIAQYTHDRSRDLNPPYFAPSTPEQAFNRPSHHEDLDMDDRPPAYTPEEAPPTYCADSPAETASALVYHTYTLQQCERGRQRLVPSSPPSSSVIPPLRQCNVTTRTRPRIFTSRPDLHLSLQPTTDCARPTDPAAVSGSFDDGGAASWPWFPKATVKILQVDGGVKGVVGMESTDFVHWGFEIGGRGFVWGLREVTEGWGVVLTRLGDVGGAEGSREGRGKREVAWWVYSRYGTSAVQGQEVGKLTVLDGGGWEGGVGVGVDARTWEMVVQSTCLMVVAYWRKMGRHYRNGDKETRAAVSGFGRSVVLAGPSSVLR